MLLVFASCKAAQPTAQPNQVQAFTTGLENSIKCPIKWRPIQPVGKSYQVYRDTVSNEYFYIINQNGTNKRVSMMDDPHQTDSK